MKNVSMFLTMSMISVSSSLFANLDVQLSRIPVGSTLSPREDIVLEPNTKRTVLSQSPNCYLSHDSASTSRQLSAGTVLSVTNAVDDLYIVKVSDDKTAYVLNDFTRLKISTSGGFTAAVICINGFLPSGDSYVYIYARTLPGNDRIQCVLTDKPNTPETPRCLGSPNPQRFFVHHIIPFFNVQLKDPTPIE